MSQKRKAISLETKFEIIQKHQRGVKAGDLMKEYSLASSTVSTIFKNQDKIIEERECNINENGSKRNNSAKRIKAPTYSDIDSAVEEWFKQTIAHKNVVIGGPEIQAQALKYAIFLNHPEFQASNGWLQRFRDRNHISFKTIVGEAGLVDTNVTDTFIQQLLPGLLASYEPRDIYNADETALFFRAQPARTMIYKNMDCNNTKICKERVSLLLTANMDGSDKLKPLVIGKSENPRCFKNINKANLPATYRNNSKGWMTAVIFKEWLYSLDRKMKGENRNILLFLDNFSGHSPNKNEAPYVLTNIKLHYFPANCTSAIQPMDQGIINSFKIRYRTHIVKRRIESIEYGSEVDAVSILDAIKFISAAWNSTTISTISNCYKKAGFKSNQCIQTEEIVEIDPSLQEFNDAWNQLNRVSNTFDFGQNDFLSIDADLPFAGVLTDVEILASMTAPKTPDIDSEEEEPAPAISRIDANKGLQAFKLFMMQSSEDRSTALKMIAILEKEMEAKTVQSTITSYFCI